MGGGGGGGAARMYTCMYMHGPYVYIFVDAKVDHYVYVYVYVVNFWVSTTSFAYSGSISLHHHKSSKITNINLQCHP